MQAGWFNLQTHVIHQTNQYVTSAQTALLNDLRDYRKLQGELVQTTNAALASTLKCQMATDVADMQLHTRDLDPSFVAADIKAIVAAMPSTC